MTYCSRKSHVSALLFHINDSCLPIAQLSFYDKLTTVGLPHVKAEIHYASMMTNATQKITISRAFSGKVSSSPCFFFFVRVVRCCRRTSNTHTRIWFQWCTYVSCQAAQDPIDSTDHDVNMLVTTRQFQFDKTGQYWLLMSTLILVCESFGITVLKCTAHNILQLEN